MFWQLAMVRAICGMTTLWGKISSICLLIELDLLYLAAYLAFYDDRLGRDFVLASTDESWTFVSLITGFLYSKN